MEILLATNNKNKIKEFESLFKGFDIKFYTLDDFKITHDVIEDKNTYYENALKKVIEYSEFVSIPVLSDDSGIEIKSLGKNFPGVKSKRFAELFNSYDDMNDFLVNNHKSSPCSYQCVLVLLIKENNQIKTFKFEGKTNGFVSKQKIGNKGFAYDSIFYFDKYKTTLGNVDLELKNKVSHRFKATQKLKKFLIENKYI